jgi:hypothetical protein
MSQWTFAGNCLRRDVEDRTRAAPQSVAFPRAGHLAGAGRVPRQRGHAMTYAAHVVRQRVGSTRTGFMTGDFAPEPG